MRVNDLLYVTTFSISCFSFFFFNDTATTEIYTLSLHDALPISRGPLGEEARQQDGRLHLRASDRGTVGDAPQACAGDGDRKSTRLNSSHLVISYAVFCLKKKKNKTNIARRTMKPGAITYSIQLT